MGLRVLHTADWQIGKGFGHIPGDAGAMLREQRLEIPRRLADLANREAIDAIVVAGDVFDSQTVADRTLRRAGEAMAAFAGPWVLVPGNHDAALAASVWTRLRDLGALPGNVHLALEPAPIVLADERLAILPAPLCRRHEPEDLTAWMDTAETPAAAVRLGLAHGTVLDRLPEAAARHNPIADDRAETAGLDYLALGDWHGTLEIAARTWYAGTPETDGFRGNDSGNALIVSLPGPGEGAGVERVRTGHFQWHSLTAHIDGPDAIDGLDAQLADLPGPTDRLVVRLVIEGAISLADRDALDEVLARWDARMHHLAVTDTDLLPRASEADLAGLQGQGFVGRAVSRLLELHENTGHPDQPYAMAALQRLFAEHRRLDGHNAPSTPGDR